MGKKKTITISIEYYKALKLLKPRQIEIVEKVAKGRTSNEIGKELYLTIGTVNNYRSEICQKLNLEGYRGLFHWCEEHIN